MCGKVVPDIRTSKERRRKDGDLRRRTNMSTSDVEASYKRRNSLKFSRKQVDATCYRERKMVVGRVLDVLAKVRWDVDECNEQTECDGNARRWYG